MKTLNNKPAKNKYVILNGQKFIKYDGFLTLAGFINTIDQFHTYKQKQKFNINY